MTIGNYTDLKAKVAAKMHRSGLGSQIDEFITLAECDIARMLDVWQQEGEITLDVAAATDSAALPDRLKEIRGVFVGGANPRELTNMPLAKIRALYQRDVSGVAKHYAISGGRIYVAPTPSEDTQMQITCVKEAERLGGGISSNDVLASYPDIYLYGAVKHGFLHIRHPERAAAAERVFLMAVREANKQSRKRKRSGRLDGVRRRGIV